MHAAATIIGAAQRTGRPVEIEILIWSGLLILLVIALGAVIMIMRRRLLEESDGPTDQAGLLDGIRQMRREGRLSEEEYRAAVERMRARLINEESPRTPETTGKVPQIQPEGERIARPGFDLTGEPLPQPRDEGDD